MSIIIAIITLLSGIVGLVAWIVKNKVTPEQRKDEVKHEFSDTLANVHRLRGIGRNVEADEMLERLGILDGTPIVRRADEQQAATEHSDESKR